MYGSISNKMYLVKVLIMHPLLTTTSTAVVRVTLSTYIT